MFPRPTADEPKGLEARAVEDAAAEFADHGIEFCMPWSSDLDDLERERFVALVKACRAYAIRLAK